MRRLLGIGRFAEFVTPSDPSPLPARFTCAAFNVTNHLRGLVVNDEMVVIERGLAIAVGGKGTDEFTLTAFRVWRGAHFVGNVAALLVVDDIFERDDQVVYGLWVFVAVKHIAYGDKAHVHERKNYSM